MYLSFLWMGLDEVLQMLVSINSAEKRVFLKQDCNLQHWYYCGWVSSADELPSPNRVAFCTFKWKSGSGLHNQEGENPRERLCRLSGCHLVLLSWQHKHSHPSFPQAESSRHPWLGHDLFLSPSNLSRGSARQLPGGDGLSFSHISRPWPQPCSVLFPVGQVTPPHWPRGFSAAYLPLLSGSNKASWTFLPSTEQHLLV